VFELIGILPGYREIDVSLWFLLFFSLFFAMLVGDAGYGAIFLGLTLWAQRKFPRKSRPMPSPCSRSPASPRSSGAFDRHLFRDSRPARTARCALKMTWLGDEEHIKDLCFWIAAIHLSIAHVWNIANLIRSPQALAQVGWLCVVWFMFFSARSVVLNLPFPSIMTWVFGAGVVLIVLFMTPRRSLKDEWFNHVMLPLNLVGSFVDVISYIRLYAVGTASFAIASTFNIMLAPMFDGWLSGLLAALLFSWRTR
jgi:V/A-type H+-transporting ATPase subunit I